MYASATPAPAITGPSRDQVVVLLIALPWIAPSPCSVNNAPLSATRIPIISSACHIAAIVPHRGPGGVR